MSHESWDRVCVTRSREYVGYYLSLAAVLTLASVLAARETKDDTL
jgi:hypothetical protein